MPLILFFRVILLIFETDRTYIYIYIYIDCINLIYLGYMRWEIETFFIAVFLLARLSFMPCSTLFG
jgi:hypothetical protein